MLSLYKSSYNLLPLPVFVRGACALLMYKFLYFTPLTGFCKGSACSSHIQVLVFYSPYGFLQGERGLSLYTSSCILHPLQVFVRGARTLLIYKFLYFTPFTGFCKGRVCSLVYKPKYVVYTLYPPYSQGLIRTPFNMNERGTLSFILHPP